jgi:hypothetical protein
MHAIKGAVCTSGTGSLGEPLDFILVHALGSFLFSSVFRNVP